MKEYKTEKEILKNIPLNGCCLLPFAIKFFSGYLNQFDTPIHRYCSVCDIFWVTFDQLY